MVFESKICRSKESAIKSIDINKINDYIEKTGKEKRDIKTEILDLMDMCECVLLPFAEASNKGIFVTKSKRTNWKIEVNI